MHAIDIISPAARSHSRSEPWLEVCTFTPFGDCLFLPSLCPQARIAPSDILAILPAPIAEQGGVLELQPKAFTKFVELNAKMQKKYEKLFDVWSARR